MRVVVQSGIDALSQELLVAVEVFGDAEPDAEELSHGRKSVDTCTFAYGVERWCVWLTGVEQII